MSNQLQISLKAARVNADLTIIEACKKIGISPSTLVKWEKNPGLVNPLKQSLISEAYNMSIDNIIFLKRK